MYWYRSRWCDLYLLLSGWLSDQFIRVYIEKEGKDELVLFDPFRWEWKSIRTEINLED